ncbi:MAG: right-handed parallel beta-helix repeat-containing protein [Chloroflexota bacterium]
MEHQRFDRLTRLLAASLSRRRNLAALLGIAAVSAAPAAGAAAAPDEKRRRPGPAGPCGKRGNDNACERNSDCCTGFCKKMKSGPNRCRCLKRGNKCSPNQTCCGNLVCRDKKCSSPVVLETCLVCASGCAYSTVADAVAAAADGADIPIDKGTYPTPPIVLTRSVTLRACNKVSDVVLSKVAATDTYMIGDEKGTDAIHEVTLMGLTLEGISQSDSFGIVQANGSSNWTVTDCTIRNGSTGWYHSGGDVTFSGSTFTGLADAIESDVADNKGNITIDDCTFQGNVNGPLLRADTDAGTNAFTITNSRITGNTGRSVAFRFGVGTMSGCTVTGNGSPSSSGGVLAHGCQLTITGTTISGNTAQVGGGIYVYETATLRLGTGVVVTGNTAPNGSGIAYYVAGTPATFTGVSSSNVFGNLTGDQCASSNDLVSWSPVAGCNF